MQSLGVALLLTNPYIYHAVMIRFDGQPFHFLRLALTPIVILALALFSYVKGGKLIGD